MSDRVLISSGTVWEQQYGYSRAVVLGSLVFVAGTTSVDEQGTVFGEGDPYAQAKYIYRKIEGVLQQAGCTLADTVRVRTFVTDIGRWEEVARAQGEVFAEIRPAATLVQVSALVDARLLVEIELDAVRRTARAPGAI